MFLNITGKLNLFKSEKKLLNFGLPNLLSGFFINKLLINLQNEHSEYFRENHRISFVYGCFPYSVWTVRRKGKYTNLKTISTIIEFYEKNNISVNLMFNNNLIKKEYLCDTFSNIVLKQCYKKNNCVFVKSKILADYIRKNYPLYNVIKIVDFNDVKQNNILIEDRYNHLLDVEKLKKQKNIYLILNPMCSPDCNLYDFHREYTANSQIHFIKNENNFLCPLKTDINFYDIQQNKNFISIDTIKKFPQNGRFNFMISDCEIFQDVNVVYNTFDIIESYIYYLIKPQYQNKIRNLLIYEYVKQNYTGKERKENA